VNRGTSTLALTLAAAVTLTGCGAKAHTPVTPAAPVTAAAPNAVTTGPAAAGTSAGAGTGTGTGKACSAGHTRATVNGTVKCLAPGQQCSAKATTQYPQYGYICRTVNGRLVLHRA